MGITNLRIITAGSPPPNPSELIASTSMRDLMAELEGQADLVIYDCPPCTSVSDALDVAPLAGTTVLVASARGRRSGLRDAAARIRNVGGRLGGVVINRVTAGEFDNYANYAYYYTED